MEIGFIGLGQMGRHIAANLMKAGGEFIVVARRADALADFEAMGARTSTQVRDLASADVIFLCLPDAAAVSEALGAGGVGAALHSGQVVVDLSTISYKAAVDHARTLEQRRVAFIDAPVSGMEARARDGTLTVMCGGDFDAYASIEPYLHRFSSKVLFMGASGSGQLTKLINQLLFDINAAALAEVLPMAAKLGLEPAMVAEVVNSGTGRSYASEFFVPRVLKNRFSEGYPLKAAYKDLVSAAEISANLGFPLPVLAAATATYQQALLRGHGDLDKGAMIKVFEELLGVEFREAPAIVDQGR